jgi:hypothetical protein
MDIGWTALGSFSAPSGPVPARSAAESYLAAPKIASPTCLLPAGVSVRTGAALAASASRAATVRPRGGEGIVPWRIVMGIARTRATPTASWRVLGSSAWSKALLGTVKRSLVWPGDRGFTHGTRSTLNGRCCAWCSRAPSRRIRSSAVAPGWMCQRARPSEVARPVGGWLARAPECF